MDLTFNAWVRGDLRLEVMVKEWDYLLSQLFLGNLVHLQNLTAPNVIDHNQPFLPESGTEEKEIRALERTWFLNLSQIQPWHAREMTEFEDKLKETKLLKPKKWLPNDKQWLLRIILSLDIHSSVHLLQIHSELLRHLCTDLHHFPLVTRCLPQIPHGCIPLDSHLLHPLELHHPA